MRIQTNEGFAFRPNKEMNEIPKYFLIYEGAITEHMYFDGIISNRNKLAINQSLSIISVLRDLEDISKSHPKYALILADEIKAKSTERYITKEFLLQLIKEFVANNLVEYNENILVISKKYIENYVSDYIEYNEIDDIVFDMFKDDVFKNIIEEIKEYLNIQRNFLDYNPNIDVINLIIDRDTGNFKSSQYDDIVQKCKTNNIKLYVSNPCFETWLLMHFEQFEQLDFDKLLENKRIGAKHKSRKYSDKMLSKIIGYDKSNLKFEMFVERIEDAIQREKRYCEDIEKLKDQVGSNIGKLIQSMRKN